MLRSLLDSVLEGPTAQARVPPHLLAKRELPPGNWSNIYVMYLAACKSKKIEAASLRTFYTVVKTWKPCLKFRKKSTHSTCFECDKIRAKMRHAKSFWEHASAADELLGHLTLTWRCRQEYWAARAQSRLRENLLTLIIDGFDKSKPVLPRWGRGRTPKSTIFEKHNRPHVNISAVYAHGYCCNVFLSDEYMSVGGNYSWETMMVTINECWKLCRDKNQSLPAALWIQADNTVKEIKNSLSGRVCSALVQSGVFQEAGLFEEKMTPTFEARGETFNVFIIDTVRPWSDILPQPVTLSGAYRPRDESDSSQIPHSFLFKKRA
ncbi:unnamed protein product, partial [Symbiodinium pilosum]